MKGCNIWLPINKKDKSHCKEGYVLGITLIILTIALLLIASFIKRQTYHQDWTKALQQTASTKLVAQDCLESNKDQVTRRFDRALRRTWSECKEAYKPTKKEEERAIQGLAAAKAYVEVSRSFFDGLPDGVDFSDLYIIKQEFTFGTPHLEKGTLADVISYNYVKDTFLVSSLSTKEFVTYKSIVEKINSLKQSLSQDMDIIKSIQGELENKLLYEIVGAVEVSNSDLEVVDAVKMYLTLKLVPNEEEELPYRLVVDEYVTDYEVSRIK
nr:hypothetical protein [uncultured Niameybacter sp.]